MIRTVITQLEKDGHVTRGYIGVEAQQINPTTAQALHLTDQSGALLAGVQPDSPAQRAGLQPGDVIRSLNGEAVKNPRDLAVHVAGVQPGETAKLEVVRDGQSKTVEVKVGELPGDQTASLNGGQQHGDHHARLGIGLAALTPDIRDQLNLPEGVRGAVVSEVQPGSPADQAGLQQGDVIVGVGTEAVHSPAEAAKALRAAENGSDHALALRILRNGEPAFVGLNLAPQDQEQG
jgi:serine protease Do